MPVEDISRHLHNPRMRYATALMQQGRVLTDADWNEMVRLEDEDRRRTVAETVCAHGTPNDGFRAVPPVTLAAVNTFPVPGPLPTLVNTFDFTLGTGSFYLGGYRFTVDPRAPAETFLTQADWLTATLDAGKLPASAGPARTDVVFVRGWEQSVTSIEDQEFRERALGGPDTTVRVRRMRRIEVATGLVASTCADAEAALRARLTAPAPGDPSGVPHSFDETETELLSKARLTVTFTGDGVDDDPCKPKQVRGFIGAENQAIRVQLVAANQFVWGYDNSAPLYRVQIDPRDATNRTIKFLTLPRDGAALPLKDQLVELLPWEGQLENREKVAALQGVRGVINTTYDPDAQTIQLQAAVPPNLQPWLNSLPGSIENPLDPAGERRYFYLRVWTGGAPLTFATRPLAAAPAPATDIPLPGTGLTLTFSQYGLPGDFWVIAARPNTPDLVVPWRLLAEAPPAGPRLFFSTLGMLVWSGVAGVVPTVQDCRERFRSLCRMNGCCTVTVGDGHVSHGDFTSINAAIAALPPSGGEVCIRRGRYNEAVSLTDLRNIVIHGCGPATRIVPPPGGGGIAAPAAAFAIDHCRGITIRDLFIDAPAALGVSVVGGSQGIVLRNLRIVARDRSAIAAKIDRDLVIETCELQGDVLAAPLGPGTTAGLEPLVFAAGDRIRIERNTLANIRGGVPRTGLGGLQIGGGSNDVEIRRNRISGGNGNGITLGSIRFVSDDDAHDPIRIPGFSGERGGFGDPTWFYWFDDDGCIHIGGRPGRPIPPDGPPQVPVSEGDLEDIRIIENRIVGMGSNGIAVALLVFPDEVGDVISIRRLLIRSNRIETCMRMATNVEFADVFRVAFGGIILADVEDCQILDNRIQDIGSEHRDAICGIFALVAQAIAIEGNVIRRLGQTVSGTEPLKFGFRGGIIIRFALPTTEPIFLQLKEGDSGNRQDGMPAAFIHGNVVVAREGRALFLHGIGPMVVTDNQFTAHGSDFLSLLGLIFGSLRGGSIAKDSVLTSAGALPASASLATLLLDALGANAVLVWNAGMSNEIYLQMTGNVGREGVLVPLPDREERWFVGGNVQFSDNQVVFDTLNPSFTLSLCAVLLVSLDHVTMADNQVDCDLGADLVIVDTFVGALSANVVGNRFKEGLLGCFLSAYTLGFMMNATELNVGTHCIVHDGWLQPRAVATVTAGGAAPPTVQVELRLNPALADPTGAAEDCLAFERGSNAVSTTWPGSAVADPLETFTRFN